MPHYLNELLQRLPALESCAAEIDKAYQMLHGAFLAGRKLLLCGNGGSASDAEHWSGELLKGFVHRRPLPSQGRGNLPAEISDHLQWALPAIPLTGFMAFSTAFANDVKPELVFAQLVWGLGQPGDVLAGFSTSGNSANVCCAAQAARAKSMPVLGFTGRAGGKLKELSDVCICVPADETYKIQEYHLPIYHGLSLMLEESFARSLADKG
jgi:D-sedoheptulose 7-phosphate isomerase